MRHSYAVAVDPVYRREFTTKNKTIQLWDFVRYHLLSKQMIMKIWGNITSDGTV